MTIIYLYLSVYAIYYSFYVFIVVFTYIWVFCIDFFFFFNQKTAYEMRISDWSRRVLFRSRRDAHPDNALLVAERAGVVVDDAPEDDVDDGEDEDSQRNRGHGAAPLTSSAASVGSSLRRCHAKTGGRKYDPPARGRGAVPSQPPGVVARWASAALLRRIPVPGGPRRRGPGGRPRRSDRGHPPYAPEAAARSARQSAGRRRSRSAG